MATQLTTPYAPEARAEIIDHVFRQLAAGRGVHTVLRDDEGMPSPSTFWGWIADDEEAQNTLARARGLAVERWLTEVIEIVDEPVGEAYLDYDKHGNPVAKMSGDSVRRAMMRAEYRLKAAAMLLPRKYGPKVDVTSGGEALKPTQLTDNRVQALVTMAIERAAAARAVGSEGDKG
jgi:hypothetical protein